MSWLAGHGYTPISLETLLTCRKGERVLPDRPVVITFDDGYQDLVQYVVPVLQNYAFPAIFFLVAGLVGQSSAWPDGGKIPLMDWSEVWQLTGAGFQIGSHSMSHPRLAEIPLEDARRELSDSRDLLEERLGCEIRHLAYPHGSYNEAVQKIASETGYHSAVSVRIGLSDLSDDVYALQRVPMSEQDSMLDFICKLRTARNFKKSFKLAARNWRGTLKRAARL
jgi:peptidoglycan/xylan/chitin deacetylase (PgdA/CDA1 family)